MLARIVNGNLMAVIVGVREMSKDIQEVCIQLLVSVWSIITGLPQMGWQQQYYRKCSVLYDFLVAVIVVCVSALRPLSVHK